jgi:hypothetical protein
VVDLFTHNIEISGIVDVEPLKPIQTWRNIRVGIDSISKILDRIILAYEE